MHGFGHDSAFLATSEDASLIATSRGMREGCVRLYSAAPSEGTTFLTTGRPYHGMGAADYIGNKLYGRVHYRVDQPQFVGLYELNLSNGDVTMHKPTYVDIDNYAFADVHAGSNGNLYMNHPNYGIAEYNPRRDSWRLLDDWELLGPVEWVRKFFQGNFSFGIVYDDYSKAVYSGFGKSYGLWNQGPWNNPGHPDHMNLHWQPLDNSWWGCYIARHSVQPRPLPDVWGRIPEHPIDAIEFIKRPMIWTMPNTK